jgi:hypothetical protein
MNVIINQIQWRSARLLWIQWPIWRVVHKLGDNISREKNYVIWNVRVIPGDNLSQNILKRGEW